jgi:prepilin-type N-terminal cleavage/methylation domain-containing protein
MGVCAECLHAERGFSLLELLVASTILAVGLLSLAQLLALSITANAAAGRSTYAAVLAAGKLEDLRALTWESLQRQAGESADYLDRAGRPLEGTFGVAAYTRRWLIDQLPADPNNALVIQVIVSSRRDDARVVAVRTRRAP